MNMHEFIEKETPEEVERLASEVGTKVVYLRQLASGFRKASRILAIALEHASDGKITRHELRPDLFGQAKSHEAA